MTHDTDIDARAAQWLVRRDQGEAAGDNDGGFERWLAADARHRTAYLRLELAWRQADRLRNLRPLDGAVDPDLLRTHVPSAASPRPPGAGSGVGDVSFLPAPRRLAFAATLAAAAIVAWWLVAATGWQTYATEIGGYQRVLLADGTVVELNTGTELKVRLTDDHRRVRLLRGEAAFKVAREAHRPFDVTAADATIRAVGTAFNVRVRNANSVEVVVTEGRVAVTRGAPPRERSDAADAVPTLSAGESAASAGDGLVVRKVAPVEVQRRLAWQAGELIFQGESLAQAVAEFNRYNRRQLVIADAALEALQVGGNFRATDPESFVGALERSFGIRVEALEGGAGYVLKR
jgi:transmembrane sensor